MLNKSVNRPCGDGDDGEAPAEVLLAEVLLAQVRG